jgi:hypothetical protein
VIPKHFLGLGYFSTLALCSPFNHITLTVVPISMLLVALEGLTGTDASHVVFMWPRRARRALDLCCECAWKKLLPSQQMRKTKGPKEYEAGFVCHKKPKAWRTTRCKRDWISTRLTGSLRAYRIDAKE